MNEKEELVFQILYLLGNAKAAYNTENTQMSECEFMAVSLIESGMILTPCEIGDKVFVWNQTRGMIYENTVVGIYIVGNVWAKNTVRLEYTNQFGEKSHRKYTWRQFGKNVFHTREDAEQAMKERTNSND